ncbi:hypothetical protein BDW62DRAFT_210589 [Aspergillus aurantiobrunneus]
MPDSDDRSVELRAVSICFLLLVCMTTILRCYVRGWVLNAFGWDDGLMILSFALFIIFSTCMIAGSFNALGRRHADLTVHQIVLTMKYMWLGQFTYSAATSFCKISVCIFLLRITVNPLHSRLIYAVFTYTAMNCTFAFISYMIRCRPVSYNWTHKPFDPNVKSCIRRTQDRAITYAFSASLCFIDTNLGIIIPVMIVRKLQMSKANKFAVVGILSLTCLAAVVTIIRISYIEQSYTNDILDMLIWTYVEVSLSIIAGNLTTLGPLLRTWFGIISNRDHTPTTPTPIRLRRGRPRGFRDISYPLTSFDETTRSRFRPDKLSITATQVQTQCGSETRDGNSSREQLTSKQQRGTSAGSAGELGPGIYRTTDLMQTSDAESAVYERRV